MTGLTGTAARATSGPGTSAATDGMTSSATSLSAPAGDRLLAGKPRARPHPETGSHTTSTVAVATVSATADSAGDLAWLLALDELGAVLDATGLADCGEQ